MTHQFSQVPKAEIPRSSFDRTHGVKTTFDAGYLIPIFVDEALPGDTFNLKMTAFTRLATPLKPFMDNVFMETFFFAVPVRLIWQNWQKFHGEQDNPGDSTDFLVPTITHAGGAAENSIEDYMGIPIGIVGLTYNALHFRAYNLIFRDWFKDQNLVDSPPIINDDGPDGTASYTLLRRRKRHDYFTSCLPFPQKGDPVSLPLGTAAPISSIPGVVSTDPVEVLDADTVGGIFHLNNPTTTVDFDDPQPGVFNLVADLSSATAATINQLRQAFQIQRLLERDARGGTRYTEIIRAHFGVTSPDSRLQRAEFLGGGSTRIAINPVAQTSDQLSGGPGAETPQGNLAAFGTGVLHNHGFTKSFTEHCVLIGLVNVRADLTYQQGLNRMWSRQTRFDYFYPVLSHLGEQVVENREIFAQATAEDEEVFGYQERFAEYRYKPSMITGQFRSRAAQSLDVWHLSQEFATLPVLGETFIEDNPPIDRVIAVQDEPHFLFDGHFSLRCARPMPLYGVPGMIDHF